MEWINPSNQKVLKKSKALVMRGAWQNPRDNLGMGRGGPER
jgi:hypothetical protein